MKPYLTFCAVVLLALTFVIFLPAQSGNNQNNFGNGGVTVSGAITPGDVATFLNATTIQDGGAPGGGTTINPTNNVLPKRSNATTFVDSALTDNGTTITVTEPITSTTGGTSFTATQGTITTSNPFINHSVTWNAAGVAFTNFFSNVTCTAAATASIAAGFGTAGTQWQFKYNAANCATAQMLSPDGAKANPAYSFGSQVGSGMSTVGGAGELLFSTATQGNGRLSTSGGNKAFYVASGLGLGWASGTDVSVAAPDTSFWRLAANVVQLGTGTLNDETGLLRNGNSCRVTGDITLPVNTATTVCSWSLPAVAKAWAWQCEIPWVISAGSGTNTIAVIANPSQTPTGTTNGFAEILTTNTGTATEATTAISASGGTTLLTSGTITPAATVFSSRTSGTLLASGTGGTFTIQMTAAGTTATAAAKAGATCLLY